MNILLFGPQGQLGLELQQSLKRIGNVLICDRATVDLTASDQITAVLRQHSPDIIVNAAAYTHVDQAESQMDEAYQINAIAPKCMAEYAAHTGCWLIHYSTDYVFNGQHDLPYLESDDVNPINVYGHTKAAGEAFIRAAQCRHLILRTSWVYSAHRKNFLKTMLSLAKHKSSLNVVCDQIGAPTAAHTIADATAIIIEQLIQREDLRNYMGDTFHLTAQGHTSWHRFTQRIIDAAHRHDYSLALSAQQVHPISTAAYPTPAKRPAYSVLNTQKLREFFNLNLPQWETPIDSIVATLKKEYS